MTKQFVNCVLFGTYDFSVYINQIDVFGNLRDQFSVNHEIRQTIAHFLKL